MTDRRDDETLRMTEAEPAPGGEDTASQTGTRYRIVSRLGKGGMGEVITVRDEVIGREVALKRIRRADPSDRLVARFLREAQLQARLEHPAIVPVHEIGRDIGGLPFFTMRKLSGTTLAKILTGERAAYSLQRLLRAFAEVCLAVEFAHIHGIVHRDLKPDNIVLGDFGEVYVLDWGVAKVIGEPDGELALGDTSTDSGSGEVLATMPGTAIGTPGYMAPEQVRGTGEVDGRADVYALGCILYEILAGGRLHPPGQLGLATALQGLDARPSLRRDRTWDVAPELDELCVRATALERDDRIATARELGDRVQRYLDGDRDLAQRRRLAAEHLTAAHDAFAAGADDEHRRGAIRQAASALALDPALAGAAELVGRLMLEPPRTTPREVESAIDEDDARTAQENLRFGIWVYLTFLAFTPLLWWAGPPGSLYPVLIGGVVIANLAVCWWGARVRTAGREWVLATANALLLVIIARGYSPALASINTMAVVFTPTSSRLTNAFGMSLVTSLAVLGPFALERIGAISFTTTVDDHGVLLQAAAIGGHEPRVLLVASLYFIAMIAAAAGLARNMKARERAAKRHLHVQAWQLRQLVPVAK
jgi:eukaryotic-like serine/threonine-protein kinase